MNSALHFDAEQACWVLSGPPHVLLRAKRVFGKVRKTDMGEVRLSDTTENARDLEWFVTRYPIDVVGAERLKDRAGAHRAEEDLVRALLSRRQDPPSFELAIPAREYQRVAAAMALGTGGLLLADDIGIGKTVSAICTFTDPSTLPALVVVPTHLPKQWQSEIARFAPKLRTHIVKKGTPYDLTRLGGRGKQLGLPGPFPDVVITNYHKLVGWAETLAPVVRSVVFDEVQELRTGAGTAKYAAATHVSANARCRIGLSATPIYNYGGELWNVMNILRPGVLGAEEEFHREWCHHVGYRHRAALDDPESFGTYAREAGLMLRRTRSEVGRELPALQIVPHHVDSDEKALEQVSASCAELARVILSQGERRRGETWMASEDFSNTLRQATGIAKAPYVASFVRMLVEAGERVVLYGWHREVYGIWLDRLSSLGAVMFTGSESPQAKQRSLERFCGGDARVLIMSLRSGSGVDGLQHHCRTVVHGELDWSPGVHEQCDGRVSRDGQTDSVVSYYLVADAGADPIISDVLQLKQQQIDGLRDPGRPAARLVGVPKDHIRLLAADYLERRGLPLPSPAHDDAPEPPPLTDGSACATLPP